MLFIKETTFYYIELDSESMKDNNTQDLILECIEELNSSGKVYYDVECFFEPFYRLNIIIPTQETSDEYILGEIKNIISKYIK
jgi:hypothetical protein